MSGGVKPWIHLCDKHLATKTRTNVHAQLNGLEALCDEMKSDSPGKPRTNLTTHRNLAIINHPSKPPTIGFDGRKKHQPIMILVLGSLRLSYCERITTKACCLRGLVFRDRFLQFLFCTAYSFFLGQFPVKCRPLFIGIIFSI